MQLDDDGVALDDLGDEQAALIRAMGGVKAKGGSMFAAAQQMNNPEGLMFTGTAVRAVAARVAASNVEKQQKQAADAELRRLAETTAAGRGSAGGGGGRGGGGRGGGGRGRLSWKAVATELDVQRKDEVAALKSRIRELEAANAGGGGGGGAPAAAPAAVEYSIHGIYKLQWPRNSPCSRSCMGNLRPLLSVNLVPVISDLVSNPLYDIIEVMKSKILPLRIQTGYCLVQYL